MPLTVGDRLGPYEILTLIGAGGMGEVYRAKDTKLGRQVAIKVLPGHLADETSARERLRREAVLVAESIVCSLISFLLCRKLLAVVTSITPVERESKWYLREQKKRCLAAGEQSAGQTSLFLGPDKTK
jgi:serine/threonine protein kinase